MVLAISGFRSFLFQGNLIELAVAVVIGQSFGNLLAAFTTGLITPLIGIFGAHGNFSDLHFTINKSQFTYGKVVDSAITFLITALVLYYMVVLPSSFVIQKFKRAQELTQRSCPECCSTIDRNAKRCPFCTSEVEPVPQDPELTKVKNKCWQFC